MEIIERSGIFIWPIILASIYALFIIIDRVVYLVVTLPKRRQMFLDIESGNSTDASADGLESELSKTVKTGKFDDEMIAVQLEKELADTARNISGLAVVAQAAPLLGLLGTVVGMIDAFVQIEALGESVSPSDLAGGIWEALLTTAAGLIVAIPAVIAFSIFNSAVNRYRRWLLTVIFRIKAKIEECGS